ncbi:hypothetical protein HAHE_18230 [Haloferula helveola]|uniref:alpha-L-rhamnosidase n=1 Tax=Haloferula helveola TaxID=490095 RepID=A0ABN6H8W3_9BACT|nr:hypothetical protein HAHE_18230 [Haloferula helveola]
MKNPSVLSRAAKALVIAVSFAGLASAAPFTDDFGTDTSGDYAAYHVLYSSSTDGPPAYTIDDGDDNQLATSASAFSGSGAIQSLFLHQSAGLETGETAILDLTGVSGLNSNENVGLAISLIGNPAEASADPPSTSSTRQDLFTASFRPGLDDFLSERFVGTTDEGQQNDTSANLANLKGLYITRISQDEFVGGWVGQDDGLNPVSSYTNASFTSAGAFIGIWTDVRSSNYAATVDNLRIIGPGDESLLFSDNFDAADGAFDSADTSGRLSGSLVGETHLRSFGTGQDISGGRLALDYPGSTPGGGLRFELQTNDPVSGATDRYDWAGGSGAAAMVAAGGMTIRYDWTPTDTASNEWHAWSIGTTNADSGDSSRVNNSDADYGILIRQSGGCQRFDSGTSLGTGLSVTTADDTSVPVAIHLAFDSFADGTSVNALTTIGGVEVANDTFVWDGNAGQLHFEVGCNEDGHLIDNLTVTTLSATGSYGIALDSTAFGGSDPVGTQVGTLTASAASSFALVSGTGDTDNGLFQIDGEQLETAADFSLPQYADGQTFSVRVRGTETGGAGATDEKTFTLTLHKDADPGALPAFPPGSSPPGAPTDLRVDDVTGPVGTSAVPYFGWHGNDPDPHEVQSAYQILVASSAANLAAGTGDLWDSGQVASDRQNHVTYAGAPLASDRRIYWKVRTWDRDGNAGPYSAPASFVVGLSLDSNWAGAEWIRRNSPDNDDYTYFRHQWVAPDKTVERATVYIAAAHKYALYCNGTLIGKGPSYHHPQYQYYNAFDISSEVLADAVNQFAIFTHWFGGGQGRPAGQRGVIMKAIVRYTDGTKSEIGTDGTWKTSRAESWVGGQPQRNGEGVGRIEEIDARELTPDWFMPSFNDAAWGSAHAVGAHPAGPWTGTLAPDLSRIVETELAPASIADLGGGKYVVDLGKVYAGVPRIRFSGGSSGTTIQMRGGYELDGSGEIDTSKNQNTDMTFRAILDGGNFIYEPAEYLGMRYFQIDNAPMPVTPANFSFIERHSEMDVSSSSFDSPDATLNAVWDLMKHSILTCAQEEYVDTPTREKGGFLGDAAIQSTVAMPVMNERVLTRRTLHEFLQSMDQHWSAPADRGRINAVYPNVDGGRDIPDYTQAYLTWVWNYYLETGDLAFLSANYARFRDIADYVHTHRDSGTGLITNLTGGSGPYEFGIVDWPQTMRFGYDMTAARTVINGWAYADYQIMAKIAGELGNIADRNLFWTRADDLEVAMNAQLINGDGVYIDGLDSGGGASTHVSQHANMFPLALGMVPAAQEASVTAKVKELEMSVGMVTLPWLVRAVGEAEEGEHLIELFTNDTWLGWARCLSLGATATWESWDADSTGESLSHAWGAAGLEGYLRYILGVRPLEPQYGKVEIKPLDFGASLDRAEGVFPTDRGDISVKWEKTSDSYRMDVDLPFNVLATVSIPKGASADPTVFIDGFEVAATVEDEFIRVPWIGSGLHTIVRVDGPDSSMDAWRVQHFGLDWSANPDALDGADPDRDGLDNDTEYGLGFDPLTSSVDLLPKLERQGQDVTIAYPAPRPELVYSVLGTEDLSLALVNWDVLPTSPEIANNIPMLRTTVSLLDHTAYFIRLAISEP